MAVKRIITNGAKESIYTMMNKQDAKLPNGAYYDEELEQVVFEDIHSLIQYVISK